MAKYAVTYIEEYRKTFLVEADSLEEAQEKMEDAAENIPLGMNEYFDHWDVVNVRKALKTDLLYCDPLPEE